jgi:hypothetical protein
MPDRLVNLQSQLRAIENDVEPAFRALLRMMQSNRFFGNTAGVLYEFQLFDQLVSLVLPLPAIGIRVRPFLNLVPRKSVGSVTRTCGILGLTNVASLRRYKPLLLAIEVEIAFGQSDTGNGAQLRVDV